MAFLTREEILAKAAVCYKSVDIPDFGTVGVRFMTPAFLKRLDEQKLTDMERGASLIRECIIDDSGGAIFHTLEEVMNLPGPMFKDFSDAVAKINKIQLDETVKN